MVNDVVMNVALNKAESLKNAFRTVFHIFEALSDQDYESAKLEIQDLYAAVRQLEELAAKQARKERLIKCIADMKKRGIDIDFVTRSSLFQPGAKNAAENGHKNENCSKAATSLQHVSN